VTHPTLTPTQDHLLRSAARIEPLDPVRRLLVGDRSNLATEARPLVMHGLIELESDGLTGTWYRVTRRGLRYLATCPRVTS